MAIKNFLTENVILPLSDVITGNSVYKCLRFLNQSQYWSREEIDNYQNAKLRDLIKHVFLNVPFYRELFLDLGLKPEDIQSKEDLKKLPIISKEDLKKSPGKHLAKNLNKTDLLYRGSSGSTGEPFQFYITRHAESLLKAAAIRGWYWMGYRLGDKYVKISMNPRPSMIKKVQDIINNSLYLSSTQLAPPVFQKIVDRINKYDPKFIRCYPVPLQFLAKQMKLARSNYNYKSLIAINTTGSTLHDNARIEIENVFNVKIFDSYSCEGGTSFDECYTHECYHASEEYAISEFIKDTFTITNSEQPLRHITTDLHNYASPFIRYDTQDYVVMGNNHGKCSCKKDLLSIKKIKGRDSDILITPSGKYLIVENFVAYFEWIPEVDQIQVVQDKLDEIVIKLIVNETFTPEVKMKIYNFWTNYIGSDVNLTLEVVDEIKLTPTGKRRTIIRNPNISLNG